MYMEPLPKKLEALGVGGEKCREKMEKTELTRGKKNETQGGSQNVPGICETAPS